MDGTSSNSMAQPMASMSGSQVSSFPVVSPGQEQVADQPPLVDSFSVADPLSVADSPQVADRDATTSHDKVVPRSGTVILKSTGSRKRKNKDDDDYEPTTKSRRTHQNSRRVGSTSRASTFSSATGSSSTSQTTELKSLPEPHGQPAVWSEKRASLCDALPYFKAHQGSVYMRDLYAYGMLIDGEVGIRDHFSSQLIITSIGGGRVKDASGKMVRTEDQDEKGKAYRALRNTIGRVIVMIGGANNRLFPVQPPHYYNVLGHWRIDAMWQEKTHDGITFWKIRLQYNNLSSRSWIAPRGASRIEAGEFEVGEYTCEEITCPTCNTSSKKMFEHGWTCLTKECPQFFQFEKAFEDGQTLDSLVYSQDFLRERTAYKEEAEEDEAPCPIVPPLPKYDDNSLGSEERFKQGIVCPECGCCNSRRQWDGWYCVNCNYALKMPIKAIPLEQINNENKTVKMSDQHHHDIVRIVYHIEGYEITIYLIPGEYEHSRTVEWETKEFIEKIANLNEKDKQEAEKKAKQNAKQKVKEKTDEEREMEKANNKHGYVGFVARLRPTSKGIYTRAGGLDDLYKDLQNADMGLERRAARNRDQKIEELTSHFSANFGAPYKFGVVVKDSVGFHSAPKAIMETWLRLTWGANLVVQKMQAFLEARKNELIPDGIIPKEFQPFNEELVLGYFEKSKISAHDDGEKELGPTVASLSLGSPSLMKFMPKKGKNIGEAYDMTYKSREPMLSIDLRHGDMLVMHGAQIQQLYNHSVDPKGIHRFALTCRRIIKETIPDAKQRELSEIDGKIPEEWDAVEYNGVLDRFQQKTTGEVVDLADVIPANNSS
ncbi:hypothetical protein F4818DRAFT_455388 [Hypoxylon cercidicola]|nr:hypothetical protein F4818DRAFT_455388 [Hypoxylon cercidicola]